VQRGERTIKKVRIVSIHSGFIGNGNGIIQIHSDKPQRDSVKDLQALQSLNQPTTLLQHGREGIPDFPGNCSRADERMSGRQA